MLLAIAPPLNAQQPSTGRGSQATRQELEQTLAGLPPKQRDGPEGILIRERLGHGDFRVGDQLVLFIEGEPKPVDTLTVSQNQTVVIPGMSEVDLKGVLRSELEERLAAEVRKYVRDPVVHAESLIRVAVLGEVAKPGFYNFAPQATFTDIFPVAGGLLGTSNLEKTVIRRNDDIIWHPEDLAKQIAAGATLDQLSLQGGDVITVGKKSGGITSALGLLGIVLGITVSALAIISFSHH